MMKLVLVALAVALVASVPINNTPVKETETTTAPAETTATPAETTATNAEGESAPAAATTEDKDGDAAAPAATTTEGESAAAATTTTTEDAAAPAAATTEDKDGDAAAPAAATTEDKDGDAAAPAAATTTEGDAPASTTTDSNPAATTTEGESAPASTTTDSNPAATTTEGDAPATTTEAEGEETEGAKVVKAVETVKEVVNLVQTLAGDHLGEEGKEINEFIDMGASVMSQVQEKVEDISSKLEETNLLQGDSILGVKEDGTIDAAAASDQISTLLNVVVGPNTVTPQDKDMMKQVIGTVSSVMTPFLKAMDTPAGEAAPQFDIKSMEPLLKLLMPPAQTSSDSLNAENLISLVKEVQKNPAIEAVASKMMAMLEVSEGEAEEYEYSE